MDRISRFSKRFKSWKHMSSQDVSDKDSPSGTFNIFRSLSRSRSKSRLSTPADDNSSEVSSASRADDDGGPPPADPLYHKNKALTDANYFMSDICGALKRQNPKERRYQALKWAIAARDTIKYIDWRRFLVVTKDLLGAETPLEVRIEMYSMIEFCLKRFARASEFDDIVPLITTPLSNDDLAAQVECLIALVPPPALTVLPPDKASQVIGILALWTQSWFSSVAIKRQGQKELKRMKSDGGSMRSPGLWSRTSSPKSWGSHDEESLLSRLTGLACLVIRDAPSIDPSALVDLLDSLIKICKKTTSATDIKESISVFNSVILHSSVPDRSLAAVVDVLCGTLWSVKNLSDTSFGCLRNLLISAKGPATIQQMHNLLNRANDVDSPNLNVIRGMVYIYQCMLDPDGDTELPCPDFDLLITSLHASIAKDSARLEGDILHLGEVCLNGPRVEAILPLDWTNFFSLMGKCTSRIIRTAEWKKHQDEAQASTSKATRPDPLESITDGALSVSRSIGRIWGSLSPRNKALASRFLSSIYMILDSQQKNLLNLYFRNDGSETPVDLLKGNAKYLIQQIYLRKDSPLENRRFALETLRLMYLKDQICQYFHELDFVSDISQCLPLEIDNAIYGPSVDFLVTVAVANGHDTLSCILEVLQACTSSPPMTRRRSSASSRTSSSSAHPDNLPGSANSDLVPGEVSLSSAASKGMVQILLRTLNTSAAKAALTFDCLLDLSRRKTASVEARITALKVLCRIRCDSGGHIYIIAESDVEYLAKALFRVAESEGTNTRDDIAIDQGLQADSGAFNQPSRSSVNPSSAGTPRSGTKTRSGIRSASRKPPLWASPGLDGLPEDPPKSSSPVLFASTLRAVSEVGDGSDQECIDLKIKQWLEVVIQLLQLKDYDWEIYSYVLVHVGSQLMNTCLFEDCVPQLKLLRGILYSQAVYGSYYEPPKSIGLRKSDVAVCVFHTMAVLVTYRQHFSKDEQDGLVRAMMDGLALGEPTSRICIHALTICCHEIPLSITRIMNQILDKMASIITQSRLAVHVLEFLAEVARLPALYVNLRDELRMVFGICVRYLQSAREHRRSVPASALRSSYTPRQSGSTRDFAPVLENAEHSTTGVLPQYVFALAYEVMILWFLSLKLHDRPNHVDWIIKNLAFKDEDGKQTMDEQSQVLLDMMQRTAYSDLGDTVYMKDFARPSDGPVQKKSWLVGMSIVTMETAGKTGLTQTIKRQASGTTHSIYQQRTAEVQPHHIPITTSIRAGTEEAVSMLPSHILLQMTTSAFPTHVEMQPIPLPDDATTDRALRNFDRNDIVDGHKVAVVYIGPGQTTEIDILANASGSAQYNDFLEGLGTQVRLAGAQFNTQGLDCSVDGEYTYAWRDRVTEIVYHIPTLMPTDLESDPICSQKKRHIGNDFVTVVFNESNLPYRFDTIPSAFNYVNIVVTPANRPSTGTQRRASSGADENVASQIDSSYFIVQVFSKPGFPKISPASDPKLLSKAALPAFVRLISLNASVFSLVWSKRGEEDDHISSWRSRLRQIAALRKRTLSNMVSKAESASKGESSTQRRTSAYPETDNTRLRALAASGGDPQVDNLLHTLAFSGWTE